MNLSGVEYMGGDISPSLIENNLMTFEDDPRFQGRFGVFDITCMVPPKVDLIHTRDVFIHIDSDLSVKALKNFEASGSKYIAVAHWPEDAGEKNEYHPTKFVSGVYDEAHSAQGAQVIGFHRFNLHLPPYCMPTPMYSVINGRTDGSDGVLGVWPLPALGRGSHPKCRPSLTEPWVRQAIDQCSPEERSKHTKSWDLAMKTRLQKWSLKKPTGIQPSGTSRMGPSKYVSEQVSTVFRFNMFQRVVSGRDHMWSPWVRCWLIRAANCRGETILALHVWQAGGAAVLRCALRRHDLDVSHESEWCGVHGR